MRNLPRRSKISAILAVVLLITPGPASSEAVTAPEAQPSGGIIDGYNHLVFAFNRYLFSYFPEKAPPLPATATPPNSLPLASPPVASADTERQSGFGPVIFNVVNEPITLAASLLVGDVSTAWNALSRFAINSTYGVFGWWDQAASMGYKPVAADLGLSLCRMGVGEGGYLVLPFVGPRTVRDAVVDLVLVNALLLTASGYIFNSGVSVQTFVIAETIEIAADVVATRQIDPQASKLDYNDFNKMRQDYLSQRRQRCKG